jgi:hypothetical protein
MKFIWQCINYSLSSSSVLEACQRLIESIKDYYDFEDLIILNSKPVFIESKNTILNKDIIDYVSQTSLRINELLKSSNFFVESFCHHGVRYNLYITSVADIRDRDNAGLIIGIDKAPEELSKNELLSLENSINLLKLNISYIS